MTGRVPWILVAVAATLGGVSPAAQSVERLVAQALRAKGGVERLRSVTGIKMSGTLRADGGEMPFSIVTQRPGHVRQEIGIQGVTVVQAFDGEHAWVLNPLAGPTPQVVPEEQVRRMQEQADFDGPLVDSARKGVTVAFDKFERIEGQAANCLKLTRQPGPAQRLCLNADTGLEIRSTVEFEVEGRPVRVDTMFGDYRDVDGVTLPFRIRTLVDGRLQSQLVIDRVQLSPVLEPGLFRMP